MPLLGENGAGKSTLMNILAGLYRPDSGEILLDGRPVAFGSPRDAIAAGIGMVHQHFTLVPSQTVTENVLLGLRLAAVPPAARPGRGRGRASSPSSSACGSTRGAKIWQLSVGEQQRVEILKLLYRGARILIMDEPTAVLAPQEIDELFRTLRSMTADGRSVVFISHKLGEVLAIADRITVMRRGKVTAAGIAARRVHARRPGPADGRARGPRDRRANAAPPRRRSCSRSATSRPSTTAGCPRCAARRFDVRAGEIVGIAAVAGNGQSELAEVITGLRAVLGAHPDQRARHRERARPRQAIRRGIAHVPEDRTGVGSAPNLSVVDNLIMKRYRDAADRAGWLVDDGPRPAASPRRCARSATRSRRRRSTPRRACSPAATSSA